MKGLSPRYAGGIAKEAMKGTLPTGRAAARLGCAKQHVNRLRRRYAAEGRGSDRRPLSRQIPGAQFQAFPREARGGWGVAVSYKAMCRILASAGMPSPERQRKAKKENAHPTRPRRKGFGELAQIDASLHPRLGSGLPKAAPRGGIDDAAAPSWGSDSTTRKRSPGIAGR
jgi:hypothetical protein